MAVTYWQTVSSSIKYPGIQLGPKVTLDRQMHQLIKVLKVISYERFYTLFLGQPDGEIRGVFPYIPDRGPVTGHLKSRRIQ